MRIRVLAAGAAVFGALIFAMPGVASAAPPTVPFQINPAAFGNPNGSFDVPAVRCVAEIGRGTATITGGRPDRWGCIPGADVHWVNLSTGATGYAKLGPGLNGVVPQAVLLTGRGQIVSAVM
ncbi:hypothetical protein ACLQ3C_20780 [Gordonia sp. DT30]|uniref:hypothetical protein n=1 Tax=Gordonia sp. DT30 TaxID=3416546 RepID=UPI003CE7B302